MTIKIGAAQRLTASEKESWTFSIGDKKITVQALDEVGAWIALTLEHKDELKGVTSITLIKG